MGAAATHVLFVTRAYMLLRSKAQPDTLGFPNVLLHGSVIFKCLVLYACNTCTAGDTLGLSISQSNLLARSASSNSLAKALALASSSGAPGLVTAGE